jgi:hypothetical protein
MAIDLVPSDLRSKYEIHEWKHACAVLEGDFPSEWQDIIGVLRNFRFRTSDITARGGGLSLVSQWFNSAFRELGWQEKRFATKIVVDEKEMLSPTHKVDPFFDRDLNNFRLLFELRAISVGVIITKSDSLWDVFKGLGKQILDKYGRSTTWMGKLLPRIEGGSGGGCPILVFGITEKAYTEEQ